MASSNKSIQKFIIYGRLPGLNEYTSSNRSNPYAGANMKKKAERTVIKALSDSGITPAVTPVLISYNWYEKDNKRDADNVSFAQKFIQDALVEEGILPDDSRKYVVGSNHRVYTDKINPRIEVTIIENYSLF